MTAEMFPEKKLIATEFCLKKEPEQNVTSAMGFRYAQEISGDLNHGACACVDWNILLDEKGGALPLEGTWWLRSSSHIQHPGKNNMLYTDIPYHRAL